MNTLITIIEKSPETKEARSLSQFRDYDEAFEHFVSIRKKLEDAGYTLDEIDERVKISVN